MSPATRLALANARAAEALIVNHATSSVELAYLRNITRKLSEAMDALERALAVAPPANREALEGMLLIDIETGDAAPVLSFHEFEARQRFAPGRPEQRR